MINSKEKRSNNQIYFFFLVVLAEDFVIFVVFVFHEVPSSIKIKQSSSVKSVASFPPLGIL